MVALHIEELPIAELFNHLKENEAECGRGSDEEDKFRKALHPSSLMQ